MGAEANFAGHPPVRTFGIGGTSVYRLMRVIQYLFAILVVASASGCKPEPTGNAEEVVEQQVLKATLALESGSAIEYTILLRELRSDRVADAIEMLESALDSTVVRMHVLGGRLRTDVQETLGLVKEYRNQYPRELEGIDASNRVSDPDAARQAAAILDDM
jgi:hypothetical protein